MNKKQREWLADGLKGMGNWASGALLFGQILAEKAFSFWLLILGLSITTLCYAIGYLLLKED